MIIIISSTFMVNRRLNRLRAGARAVPAGDELNSLGLNAVPIIGHSHRTFDGTEGAHFICRTGQPRIVRKAGLRGNEVSSRALRVSIRAR
jgi:hypothetical protein